MMISRLKRVRRTILVLGFANLAVIVSGCVLTLVSTSNCDSSSQLFPLYAVCLAACVKLAAMVKVATTQELMAITIMDSPTQISLERKMKYKTWLWWTRFAMVITLMQFLAATFLMFRVSTFVSPDGMPRHCVLGLPPDTRGWKQRLQVSFLITVCFVALAQCFTGSDILQWRSFYATQDDAWKAHYQEVFDHGIREVLCCLGRREYMGVIEEDEVCSVARLLGDLVSYRASGTGHLEFLAGLALLQNNSQFPEDSYEDCMQAPAFHLQEAATFHKFAEAAYTGPLLDVGRNPALFLCTWICRQGILTPWSRKWRPKLDGDNWWRGHAAAFLKFIDFPAHVLRRGRICSEKCKATYFVVVLHYLRCVVIAVRGTETAEDLITDGLGRACSLTPQDLDGLTNRIHVMDSSRKHYGHSGIVEAARDLFRQIEGDPGESGSTGFLSSLIGDGCECAGYSIRIVGHSLGGAIASLLGIRLRCRFPNLYVYAYGPLPCVDQDVAESCSEFVTSIVLDNEFSSRLSYGSIRRLQVAAIKVLSQDPKADTALIFRLARRFLSASKRHRQNDVEEQTTGEAIPSIVIADESQESLQKQEEEFINPFHEMEASTDSPVSQFMETGPTRANYDDDDEEAPEMFLPGSVIHIVHEGNNMSVPIWRGWPICDVPDGYKAYVANRESFKEIMVSPSMFLDHLPWRCRHAMQKVLESRSLYCDLTSESDIV
nr:PREDICTED: sn1-specific diacylglycerol lipase beta-like [Raphanus sativus]